MQNDILYVYLYNFELDRIMFYSDMIICHAFIVVCNNKDLPISVIIFQIRN